MNLNHIKIFVAVYRAGSFALVAKDLNVAASSISRAIASLETNLQSRLFQRTTRNLTPTQAGERYFQRVEALIEEFDIAHQALTEESLTPSGKLRITASVSFGLIVLSPLLKEFQQLYPNITIEFTLSDTHENIVADQFDIAIRHGQLVDSSLVARKLMNVDYLLVASPAYIQQAKPIVTPQDILTHSHISFSYKDFNKEWFFRARNLTETVPITPTATLTTAAAIKICVEQGMGIAMLPDWSVKTELASKRLIHVLPKWKATGTHMNTGIWLVYPSRAFIPAKTAAFADYLLQRIKQ